MLSQDTPIRPFSLIRCLAVFLITALLLGLQPVPEAHAATITVDTLADNEIDGCGTNNCTLREAIADAADGDTITFNVTGTITLTSGQLTIDKDLTITGPGATQLKISGNSNSRVFEINSGAEVTISGLEIADGRAPFGGGIYNYGGTLTITDSTISGNTAEIIHGGGIYNWSGTLTITNSIISSNTADSDGGGIIHRVGTLTITNSTISSNTADSDGGGIYNWGGTLTIENSTLSDNEAGNRGGAIWNEETLTVTNSTLSRNEAKKGGGIINVGNMTINNSALSSNTADDGEGGGINNQVGNLTITNSSISDNTSTSEGGGIYNLSTLTIENVTFSRNTAENGGGILSYGTLTIENSTLSDNTSTYDGGGIFHNNGTLTITNSTLSGNEAGYHGGGLFVSTHYAKTSLYNVTISENVADSDTNGTGDGGGVYRSYGQLNLENTIIANNQDGSSSGDVHPDCSGTLYSGGYNLIEDTTGCTIIGDTTGNLTGQAALLDALADNGGETETHALGDGSPAIDAGNPDGCQDDDGNDLTADQRGEHRPAGGTCDIGAYEKQGPDLEAVKTNDVDGSVTLGATFQWAVTISNTSSQDIVFSGGQPIGTIFQDDLPAGSTYGAPTVQNVTDVTNSGHIDCQLIGTTLRCDPVGADVTLLAETGTFDVIFDVTPSATGDLTNPDTNGVCQVDPDDHIAELNESDNDCTDTVTVLDKPDLQVTNANDTGGIGVVGTAFNWTVTLSNVGASDATFADGQTIFQDDLPSTGASYGTPSAQNFTDITNSGEIDCGISGTTLTCTANSADVTLGAVTASFDVTIGVTPNAEGNLINPVPNGICRVDPDDHIDELNESDNDCADTVTVTAAGGDGGGDDEDVVSSRPSHNCPVGVPGGICRLRNLVKVTVFENTVSDGSYILIQEKAGGQFQLGDRVFDVTIIGPAGGAIATFDPPIEVCLRPTNAELKTAGWHYGNLSLFHSHAGGPWEAIYNTYEQDGKVCAKVWQLSRFALGVAPLPDTGFAPGVEHALPTQPAEKAYVDLLGVTASEAWQSPRQGGDRFVVQSTSRDDNFVLEIPSLDLELPIVGVHLSEDGWDVRWLGSQAGWLHGTAFPTWAGNTAITAHVWDADNNPGPFVDLGTLQHGDEIIIHAWGLVHTYEVRGVERNSPDDLRALPHEDYDVLTLLTCQGFDETSKAYDSRLAVRAVLMDVEVE